MRCKQIQNYLLKLHNILDIQQWILSDKFNNNNNNNNLSIKYQPIGKTILNEIRNNLDKIISDFTKNKKNVTQEIPIIRAPQIFDNYNNNNNIKDNRSSYIGTRKACSYYSLGVCI